MREIFLSILLLFSVSMYAAGGDDSPLGWYTVDAADMVGVTELTADAVMVPRRSPGSAAEQTDATLADGTETAIIVTDGDPTDRHIGAAVPFEVGWEIKPGV